MIIVCLSTYVLAEGVDLNQMMAEAQSALNVNNFDAASAVGSTFSDSISPYTGALTITQTDATLIGRNGLNADLTRYYSSNIFLNVNHYGSGGSWDCPAIGINNVVCDSTDPYVSCLTPNQISGKKIDKYTGEPGSVLNREMRKCDKLPSEGMSSSSFIRAKYLGRGWSMNFMENKIRDPSPLVIDNVDGIGPLLNFEFVSMRGINELSMVLMGNEERLILPSMYARLDEMIPSFYLPGNSYWGLDAGYQPYVVIYGDGSTNIPADDPVTYLQQAPTVNPGVFVAYTSDMSPIWIWRFFNPYLSSAQAVLTQAQYYAKDGLSYAFNHYVSFCDKYDDIFPEGSGSCGSMPYPGDRENTFTWAENPYAGFYLTSIYDSFGNHIVIDYHGLYNYPIIPSPFVESIAVTAYNYAYFKYVSKEGAVSDSYSFVSGNNLDINSRLKVIQYTNPKGETNYINYKYRSYSDSQGNYPALLSESYISTSMYGSAIPGTHYYYEYDSSSQELIKVILPTGAEILYEYGWATDFPSYDVLRGMSNINDPYNLQSRRVVIKRTVRNGGSCGSEWLEECSWEYKYKTVFKSDRLELETTVVDPYGNKVVYNQYPATTASLNNI